MSFFPRSFAGTRRKQKLTDVTVRGFGGGWNTEDDDLSMSPKYQPVLKNFHRTTSGAQELRFGTQFFTSVEAVMGSDIVDIHYFNGRIIAPCENGEVASITDAGVVTAIWNASFAAALTGAPDPWSGGVEQVDFVPFKDTLVIHNGVDKPITIDDMFTTDYLQDLATGSNVNVPIGKYGCVVSNYHVVAGIPADPTTIYIASLGTAGVFVGDPDPNDSITLDVGAYVPDGGAEILGIGGFKTFLFVFFRGQTLIITLGIYNDDGDHTPDINDTLPDFGLLSHRCFVRHDNDLIFADRSGVNGARRNLFAGLLDSTHLSDLINTDYQGAMGALTDEELMQTFMVLDKPGNRILVFEPNGRTFVRSASERLKYQSWSEYQGLAFTAACTSFLGRVFLVDGMKIFQLGNRPHGELYRADRLLDRDATWALMTAYVEGDIILDAIEEMPYKCLIDHTSASSGSFEQDRESNPIYWEAYEGEDIEFEIEFPWQDGRNPNKVKHNRFMSVETKGTAQFTVEAYVDNYYKDADGVVNHNPALSMQMIGNDAAGYGIDEGPYGGGRQSADPRLYKFPVKFKTVKFRIYGATKRPLQIIGYSLLYAMGLYKR